jgi:actin-like ATPase involved in cell morphogenesis
VLAIDFGTSFSSAALAAEEGVDLVDIHGDRRVPSMVVLGEDGRLLVGMLAANRAAAAPERLERTPKAQVGRSPVLLLGGHPIKVVDAVSALLAAFVDEARRRRGGDYPAAVTLTHPVRWGAERRRVLEQAAQAAGLDPERAHLVEEPVAAASAFRSERVTPGSMVAVYDLGGGTFDAAVLEATESGFVVAGPPGGDDNVGGEEFDERLLAYVGEQVAAVEPDGWESLSYSDERRWRRAHSQLRDQVRLAKETLSISEQATVYVPGVDREILVTRAEFERLIADDVERTLDVLDGVIEAAGVTPEELTAVYPVGGSSRIPLVANRLMGRYGERVVTWDDPQAAVALGAARLARHNLKLLGDLPAAPAPAPPPEPEPELEPEPDPELEPEPEPEAESEPEPEPPVELEPEPEFEPEPELESEPEPAPPPEPEPGPEPDPEPEPEREPVGSATRVASPGPRRRRRPAFVALGAVAVIAVGVAATLAGGLFAGSSDESADPDLGIECARPAGNNWIDTLDRGCFTRLFEAYREDVPGNRRYYKAWGVTAFTAEVDQAFGSDVNNSCRGEDIRPAGPGSSGLGIWYEECVGMVYLYTPAGEVVDVQLTDKDDPQIPVDWTPGLGNAFSNRAGNEVTVPLRGDSGDSGSEESTDTSGDSTTTPEQPGPQGPTGPGGAAVFGSGADCSGGRPC